MLQYWAFMNSLPKAGERRTTRVTPSAMHYLLLIYFKAHIFLTCCFWARLACWHILSLSLLPASKKDSALQENKPMLRSKRNPPCVQCTKDAQYRWCCFSFSL